MCAYARVRLCVRVFFPQVIVKAGLSASSAQSGPQGSQDELMTARYLSSSKLFGLQVRAQALLYTHEVVTAHCSKAVCLP